MNSTEENKAAIARRLRALPAVESVLVSEQGKRLQETYGRARVISQLRSCLDAQRKHILNTGDDAGSTDLPALLVMLEQDLKNSVRTSLVPVINATGIAVHTNLGRAPLAPAALEAIAELAAGYSNLEFDLETGKRGSRGAHIEAALCELTGAQAALVVNNCAAAIILALAAHGRGGEVLVSRGELVEIGGAFRMPDVIAESGASMREVGTTNRTRLTDYRSAINERTRILLNSHPSNYRVMGFTEQVPLPELCALAHEHQLLCIQDLGSGAVSLDGTGLEEDESSVVSAVAAGADIITFSGDKLLGGPQAGIIVGSRQAIAPLRRHPLHRAMRIDKLSLAALSATAGLYLEGKVQQIPIQAMLRAAPESLRARAEKLHALVCDSAGFRSAVQPDDAYAGGGALPTAAIAGWAVVLRHETLSANALQTALRSSEPAVIARVHQDAVKLNVLTLSDEQLPVLQEVLSRIG